MTLSFAVLGTVYDYFIVSGPMAFVEKALGCTIAESRSRFLEYASGASESDRLIAVARRYEGIN
jgi:hypothetical protein